METWIDKFGFPVACVIALALFVVWLIKRQDNRIDAKDILIAKKDVIIEEIGKDSITAIKDTGNFIKELTTTLTRRRK